MADDTQYVLLEDGPDPVGGRQQSNREPIEQMTIRAEGTTNDHSWVNTHQLHTIKGVNYVIFKHDGPTGTHSYSS